MRILGYVREKDGNFKERMNRIYQFCDFMNFKTPEMICEESDKNISEMNVIKKIIRENSKFVLIVSDASDLFEDEESKLYFLNKVETNNIFLIDSFYPNFDCKMLLQENCKENPSEFLINSMILQVEIYLRLKKSNCEEEKIYNDMICRFEKWKNHENMTNNLG